MWSVVGFSYGDAHELVDEYVFSASLIPPPRHDYGEAVDATVIVGCAVVRARSPLSRTSVDRPSFVSEAKAKPLSPMGPGTGLGRAATGWGLTPMGLVVERERVRCLC
jgi:hypothetical protein